VLTSRNRDRHSALPEIVSRFGQGANRRIATGATLSVLAILTIAACGSSGDEGTSPEYIWDFSTVYPYLPKLVDGIQTTIELTVIVILISMPLGVFVAAGRLSRIWVIRAAITAYIEVMRGVPNLVLLFWVYYVLPVLFGLNLSVFAAGVLGLSLNVTAFYGEAFRSGIQSIPRVEMEAGDILGFKYTTRLRYIIIPQAFRAVLPVLISLSVSLFKDTSLVSTLGVMELMYQGEQVATATYRPMEVFTSVAVFYLAVAIPVTLLARRLEVHMRRHLRV
jgi:polar amino acid transport system permease protein